MADNPTQIRLAIVGCGAISRLNIKGYLEDPRCRVTALCDPIRERAVQKATEWGIDREVKIYTNYDDLLKDPNIDAVELLTPTHLHTEQILAGLDSGKHISCQKPLCNTLEEASLIENAVNSSRRLFRVTENFIYYPPIVKAKELIDGGQIGKPSMVRIRTIYGSKAFTNMTYESDTFKWRSDIQTNPRGHIYDDGWHKYATATWWTGDVEKVTAIVSSPVDGKAAYDDTPSAAIMKTKKKDCILAFEYCSALEMPFRTQHYPQDEFFEIVGSKGTIWVTRCSGQMLNMAPVVLNQGNETTNYNVPSDWIEGFKGASRAFIDGILGETQPDMDINFSTKVLEVAMSVYKSSETESTIYMKH